MATSASAPPTDPAQRVLREARRLHHAARSAAPSESLPVLRRLLAAGAVPAWPLTRLFRERASVQRKHLLRMLAVECGHESWEHWRSAAPGEAPAESDFALRAGRHPHLLGLWFSTEAQAREHAAAHGGEVLRVGRQAVVLPAAVNPPDSVTAD